MQDILKDFFYFEFLFKLKFEKPSSSEGESDASTSRDYKNLFKALFFKFDLTSMP